MNTSNNFKFNLRHSGQYYDSETGLFQNNLRDYSSSMGRYIEADPIGLNGGSNRFAYVGNNPLSYSDEWGLKFAFSSANAEAYFGQAMYALQYAPVTYNGKEMTMGDVYRELDASISMYNVDIDNPNPNKTPDEYNPDNKTLYWNPLLGSISHGKVCDSPLTILAHEMGHMYDEYIDKKAYDLNRSKLSGLDYWAHSNKFENKEEDNAMHNFEYPIADYLHDGHRIDHTSTEFTPVSSMYNKPNLR